MAKYDVLDRSFFIELAKDVVPMFRQHTFVDGKDVKGKKFKKYSEAYGKAKRTGKMFRQDENFAKRRSPVLTSDLLRDWTLRGTSKTGFSFGTLAYGGRVNHLAKMGRVITSEANPVPKHIDKHIRAEANKYVQKRLNKIPDVKINIKK